MEKDRLFKLLKVVNYVQKHLKVTQYTKINSRQILDRIKSKL